jgi:hypothetical protein
MHRPFRTQSSVILTTSEAHGYEMVIFALIAGYDRTSETRDVSADAAFQAEATPKGGQAWA